MIETLRPNWYRLEIPLPGTPLKALNAYVICSDERNLIIDTGLNHAVCRAAMAEGLDALGVDMNRTDIFITHFHADHFSLIPMLATPTSRIFFNRPDIEVIESWDGINSMVELCRGHGFPVSQLRQAFEHHPAIRFGTEWVPDASLLMDGETLQYGDYCLTCIETPGHSLGHLCLYEEKERILVAGDHLLIDITPNIQGWDEKNSALEQYFDSLRKVYPLDVELVLPGHRRLFSDHRKRIDELLEHHEKRLQEIRDILKTGPCHAYDTASKMTWDIRADHWEAFPHAQKWFATGEALAHLQYLERMGEIGQETIDGNTVFYIL